AVPNVKTSGMELSYSLHNYKDKPCLAIYQKLKCDPCGKEIEEVSRIWIHTHKNEGFDYKLEQPFILKLLGDTEKIWHYMCHSLRERCG
ncbi:MAG: hypothetical protein WAZ77_17920, partial [Candidatus Nitrosopolaris sp.]